MQPYEPKHLHKMTPNWLFPYLIEIDRLPGFGSGRWGYWVQCIDDMKLPDEPIPQISFADQPNKEAIQNITDCLKVADQQGVRHSSAFEFFVVWLLHGFGYRAYHQYETADKLPNAPRFLNAAKVLDAWYETFNLGLMLQHPADYMAFFSQGGANKDYNPYQGSGFFATPMSVCKMMAEMNFGGQGDDLRAKKTLDCCAGTGSLLLAASNYSMRLYAQDISQAMCNCILVNAYLYMPWMVFKPDFSRFDGPTWEQVEDALFGAPESQEQPVLVQLPMFEPAQPEPVMSQNEAETGFLLAITKAFELIEKTQEQHVNRRLMYADEYSYEWRLSEQMAAERRTMTAPDFQARKEEKKAA